MSVQHIVDNLRRDITTGLPSVYKSVDDYMYDFWSDFSWTPEGRTAECRQLIQDEDTRHLIRAWDVKFTVGQVHTDHWGGRYKFNLEMLIMQDCSHNLDEAPEAPNDEAYYHVE